MKLTQFKRPISWLLAFAMVLTLCPTVALAGDTLPYTGESALAENEPTSHGYRAEDLLTWDPATDPDAELLRARVPLQERIEPLAATQANPALNPEVEYLTLAGDYGNAFFGGTSYTNEFSEYVFNFWQYIDYYAPWHGQTTATTPFELWDSQGEREGTSNWEKRAFEFGMMNLPNAAYTNAAHKNGVLSLGCIFLPRAYQSWRTLIQRDEDGGFPYADKLIEIAEYYGFDGWFVNLEGSDSPSGEAKQELQAMLAYMREQGQYIQYYNAGGSIDTSFLTSGAADSFFKDYGWSTSGAVNEVANYGYSAVHGGFEAGGNRWRNNFSKMWSNGEVVCSIATLGTDFVHAGIDEDFGNYLEMRRENDDFQWMSAIRERMWFTGSSGDPTDSTAQANAEVGVSSNQMPGIASLVTERSVISGDTFYTNFNTGHGLVYAIDGTVSNDHEWANISIQDILPTWQFWFETEGTALKAEYDYGTGYKKGLDATWTEGALDEGSTTYGEFDFDLVDPYHGGSSLAIYGGMDADNFLHLYKTALDVTESSNFSITFKKTSSDEAAMSLGLVFAKDIDTENNTYTVTEFALENTTAAGDWTTATVDLSAYAGEQIAMIGLNFRGTADDYQMHLGRIEYLSGRELTPAAPENLTIDKAYDSGEMVISWDLGDYDTVKQYNVYAVVGGEELYMGGIYDDIYYIKNIYDMTGEVTIKVTAVGADGSESEAATAVYDYTKAVTDLSVEAADGTLTVSFTPLADAATELSVYLPATGQTYTASALAGETSAVVTVPAGSAADGKEYELRVTAAGGEAKAFDGQLDDSYCIPYDGPMTGHKLTSPVACADWYLMDLSYVTYGGDSGTTQYTRGKKSHGELNNDWSRFQSLPGDILTLEVTLTDYAGNVSETVTYNFDTEGEPVFPEEFQRVFHLDAGRKYFSVENIKALIDILAEADMNQLELYFSDNQGFRLALNDMTLTTEYGTYDLTPALGDGYSDGSKYPDGTGKYLTQEDFESILAYANEKDIEIVPCANVPGHMGAILEVFPSLRYSGSQSSIDLTSDEAKAFAKTFIQKYAEYFASVGCKRFSFGADEFANDLGSTMGFEQIYNNGIYAEHFVPFFNDVAAIIKDNGMIPRAFNDGVYYNDDTSFDFDTDVEITYWASGWGGYNLCDADILSAKGFELINTSQGYYWVLGNAGWQVSPEKAGQFDYTLFDGGVTVYNPAGAMLCVWCDNGAADGDDGGAGVVEKIRDVLIAFGGTLPAERSSVPIIDATYFPDPAVLAAVMEQVGPYVTDLSAFEGKLDLSGTSAADLTGIAEHLTGLTGLDLSGTKLVKLTSDMLPAGITELKLANCTALEYVELVGHPDLVVDFSGCTNVVNLYLHGTSMTELNISAMTGLRNFDISDSQIAILSAASPAKYQNAYWWNWENAKLDLSDFSAEGKLRSGMESYFATAELPDEIDSQESVLMNAGTWYYYNGTTKNIDLGSVSKLSSLSFYNSYADWYGSTYSLKNAVISVSVDGEAYTEILTFTHDGNASNVTIPLPEGTEARYIRLTSSGNFYTSNWVVNGYAMAPKGFTFIGQQPALVREEMADVIYERDGRQYQLLDLLEDNYNTFQTLRGTPAEDILNADWADTAYIRDAIAVPKSAKVTITDKEGNVYVPSTVEPPELGELDNDTNVGLQASILGQSGQYANEYSYMLFDGKNNTKWCTGGNTGWAVFQLPESAVIGRWYTEHAGMLEAESMNTRAFSLQILNPDVLSEEDFLAMSSSEQSTVMRTNSYWMDLDTVTDNTATYVDRTIAEENLQEAQVYRLYVSQSVQETTYGAIRIYEMELFTYTGKLKLDTNGIFVADQIGTWNVSYTHRGEELGSLALTVRLSDEDLVALSESVEAAEAAAEEAAKVAEEARAAAEEAQKKAEEAAASSAEDRENAEKAAAEAAEALAAAEAAEAAARDAQTAAEAARDAAATYNTEAAASAAAAAEYAAEAAEAQAAVAAMKAEIVEYLADAQKAAEEAEEAQRKAEEAQRKAEEAALAAAKYYALIELSQVDLDSLNPEQRAAAEEAIARAREALDTAATPAEVEAILAEALAAIEEASQLICASDIFTDVEPDAWYHEGVDFMVRNGYMNGISESLFDLNSDVKRAQLVTILYRVAGEPSVEGLTHSFNDVEAGSFYEAAVIWAANNGIVNGMSDTMFAPNSPVSREQLATILYRYCGSPAVEEDHLAAFPDQDTVSGWAADAMNWAVANGLVNGVITDEGTILSPVTYANRAQIAVILTRHLTAE